MVISEHGEKQQFCPRKRSQFLVAAAGTAGWGARPVRGSLATAGVFPALPAGDARAARRCRRPITRNRSVNQRCIAEQEVRNTVECRQCAELTLIWCDAGFYQT